MGPDHTTTIREQWMSASLLKTVAGVIVGALLGYAYYRFVGCATGACPLTSNPWVTTIYGAVIGFLVTS